MEFYEQKSTTFRNQNGRVRSAFKVVKAKDGVMKSMEGISNKNDASLYHILQTIRKNNMEMRSKYSIHMDDLKKLLIEGDRMNDYKKIENTPVVRKRRVTPKKVAGKIPDDSLLLAGDRRSPKRVVTKTAKVAKATKASKSTKKGTVAKKSKVPSKKSISTKK